TGTITMFGGSVAPGGWLLCQGDVYPKTAFPDLYLIIGTTYNVGGEGSTVIDGIPVPNMRLPNFMGKFAMGGLDSVYNIGSSGGLASVSLTTTQIPTHLHSITDSGHNHLQNAHNHNDPGHNHPDPKHTHPDPGHNHAQTAHNHTTPTHNHGINVQDLGHVHSLPIADANIGYQAGGTGLNTYQRVSAYNTGVAAAYGNASTGLTLSIQFAPALITDSKNAAISAATTNLGAQ